MAAGVVAVLSVTVVVVVVDTDVAAGVVAVVLPSEDARTCFLVMFDVSCCCCY